MMSVTKRGERLNKMLALATKTGDKEKEGALLTQLGNLSLSLFEYAKAKDYFQRSLAIWQEKGERKEEGNTLNFLGNVCSESEEYQQAKKTL